MTAHQLAAELLQLPDLPVVVDVFTELNEIKEARTLPINTYKESVNYTEIQGITILLE